MTNISNAIDVIIIIQFNKYTTNWRTFLKLWSEFNGHLWTTVTLIISNDWPLNSGLTVNKFSKVASLIALVIILHTMLRSVFSEWKGNVYLFLPWIKLVYFITKFRHCQTKCYWQWWNKIYVDSEHNCSLLVCLTRPMQRYLLKTSGIHITCYIIWITFCYALVWLWIS